MSLEERRMAELERFNRRHNAAKHVVVPLVCLGAIVEVICLIGMIISALN